jgi:hypothetical protein
MIRFVGNSVRIAALGLIAAGSLSSLAAEPASSGHVQQVAYHRQAYALGTNSTGDADCPHEVRDWRTVRYDESRCYGRFRARLQAHSLQSEAWHMYIRGYGPAIHERPVTSPYGDCRWLCW